MDDQRELLHQIDKRLAVLEAMSTQHMKESHQRFDEFKVDLDKIGGTLESLRVKVAGISATVAVITSAASYMLFK